MHAGRPMRSDASYSIGHIADDNGQQKISRMNEDGNGSPHAAPTVASISRAAPKRTGAGASKQQHALSSLGKRARSSGNLNGNNNLQGANRNAKTLSHAVGHSTYGGRGAVITATHHSRSAQSKNAATTNTAASNSTKNNANINTNAQVKSLPSANSNQWFDKDGIRFLVLIGDNAKSLRKITKMLTVDGKEPDEKILAMAQQLSNLYEIRYGQNDSLETSPLTQENEKEGGVYHWPTDKNNSTIGETCCFTERGKYRLESEGQLLDGVPATQQIRARMSVVHTTKKCVAIMMSEGFRPILDTIVNMKLPRLCFHRSKMDKLIEKISRVCIELCVASLVNGFNKTVFEDIITKLSDEIEELFKLPDPDKDCLRVIKKTLRYYPIFTWGPGGSFLHELMGDSPSLPTGRQISTGQVDFLRAVIRPVHVDRFLQNNAYNDAFGNSTRLAPFVNCVESKDNPLVTLWFKVIDELIELYSPSIMESFLQTGEIPIQVAEKAEQIVSQLHGVADYVSPSEAELEEAYNRRVLEVHNKCKDEEGAMITMEKEVFNRLSEKTKAIIIPPGSEHYIQPDIDGKEAESVFETQNGPDVRVLFSFHVTLGHNKTTAHRVKCWKRTLATLVLNNNAKLLSDAEFDHQLDVYKCFFMRLVGLNGSLNKPKGSLYDALKGALPKGLCNPHFGRQGTQMTANAIGEGISQKSAIAIRCFLERDKFDALLTSCGRPTNRLNPSPLDDPSQIEVWEREKNRKSSRKYYQEHREERCEYAREYYQEHREERCEYERQLRAKENTEYLSLKQKLEGKTTDLTNEEEMKIKKVEDAKDWMREYNVARLAMKKSAKDQKVLAEAMISLKKYNACGRNLDDNASLSVKDLKPLVRYIIKVENRDGSDSMPQNRPKLVGRLKGCKLKDDNGNVDLNLYFGADSS